MVLFANPNSTSSNRFGSNTLNVPVSVNLRFVTLMKAAQSDQSIDSNLQAHLSAL